VTGRSAWATGPWLTLGQMGETYSLRNKMSLSVTGPTGTFSSSICTGGWTESLQPPLHHPLQKPLQNPLQSCSLQVFNYQWLALGAEGIEPRPTRCKHAALYRKCDNTKGFRDNLYRFPRFFDTWIDT
jgi:hypothetical protein